MIDKIPFEIQVEIMKRLPVKSLIQFRSVSKEFNSLISNSDFIARYSALQAEPQHLLVFEDTYLCDEYRSAIISDDDDNFPQQRVTFTISKLFYWLNDDHRIIGSSHGLVCLYGDHRKGGGGHRSVTGMAVLWNPSIRKAVGVIVPNLGDDGMCLTTVGFGVCGETMDPKIVKITYIRRDVNAESVSCIPSQVEVFTLSTGVWRSPHRNLPRKSIDFGFNPQVVVDGFIFWLTIDHRITRNDGGYKSCELIVSFDLTTEEFREVILPDSLAFARHNNHFLDINTLRNSLVVIDYNHDENNRVVVIWMMRVDGVFTKLFNLKVNTRYEYIMGFRKNGAPIVETGVLAQGDREVVVYEPNSKNMDHFWIHGVMNSEVGVYPYMETLLLLDQPDLLVYNDISIWRANNKRLLKHTS